MRRLLCSLGLALLATITVVGPAAADGSYTLAEIQALAPNPFDIYDVIRIDESAYFWFDDTSCCTDGWCWEDGYWDDAWWDLAVEGSDGYWGYFDVSDHFWVDYWSGGGGSGTWHDFYDSTASQYMEPVSYVAYASVSSSGGWGYAVSAQRTAQPGCGDAGLDALIGEYVSRSIPRPRCIDFKQISPGAQVSSHFTWGDVNHFGDNPHAWAIVTGWLLWGLDTTQDNYYADPYGENIRVTSGYRCPERNAATPGSDPMSHHLWGKAADMKPWSVPPGVDLDYPTWQRLSNAAWGAGVTGIEAWERDHSHVHGSWNY